MLFFLNGFGETGIMLLLEAQKMWKLIIIGSQSFDLSYGGSDIYSMHFLIGTLSVASYGIVA